MLPVSTAIHVQLAVLVIINKKIILSVIRFVEMEKDLFLGVMMAIQSMVMAAVIVVKLNLVISVQVDRQIHLMSAQKLFPEHSSSHQVDNLVCGVEFSST